MLMGQRGRDTLDRVARRQGPCADSGPRMGARRRTRRPGVGRGGNLTEVSALGP